jgi:acetyl-CoA C-acetyltransferase
MSEAHACRSGKYNGAVGGRIKVSDCSQVTDGAVALLLASEDTARRWAQRRGIGLDAIPEILGWGHRTAPIAFERKVRESAGNPFVLPHTRRAILDAFWRAGCRASRACRRSKRTTASRRPSTWPSITSA